MRPGLEAAALAGAEEGGRDEAWVLSESSGKTSLPALWPPSGLFCGGTDWGLRTSVMGVRDLEQ